MFGENETHLPNVRKSSYPLTYAHKNDLITKPESPGVGLLNVVY
ncbi:MAG TPA: hypothetical protein VNU19_13850 [Candidatus Acidoferrum sp.]|nr:hypothetical protein [Candidatus Acidoferrum sp.]